MEEQQTFLSKSQMSVDARVLAARIDMILHSELSPLGFERIGPRRWVDSSRPPIRRMFEFQRLKGEGYSTRWGFSIDFVPTQRNGKLAWKRTARTARFDLCIDPIDREERVEWRSISGFIVPQKTYDWGKVTRAVLDGVRAAQPDFARVASPRNVVEVFRERSAMQFRRFTLENYIRTDIAWGLCLVSLGHYEEAEIHLQKYCARFSIDRNNRILRAAEQAASSITEI
jgi:hypothetical protein